MSYVKSMFTLSAFSTFLKMIPINHIDTKSFLLEKNTKRARSLRICLDVLVERLWMKLDSLVPVLFRSREWLGVYMSQGNVLVPLQVSHQNTDLWLHQADPGEKKTNKKNNNIKTWSGRVHHKAVLTGNDVIDRWWSQLKVIPHQSRWFLSILIWCMRAALNSTYKAADSRNSSQITYACNTARTHLHSDSCVLWGWRVCDAATLIHQIRENRRIILTAQPRLHFPRPWIWSERRKYVHPMTVDPG